MVLKQRQSPSLLADKTNPHTHTHRGGGAAPLRATPLTLDKKPSIGYVTARGHCGVYKSLQEPACISTEARQISLVLY